MNTSQSNPTPPPNTGDTDIDQILSDLLITVTDNEHIGGMPFVKEKTLEAKAAITKKLTQAKVDALNGLWQNHTERIVAYDDENSLRQGWLHNIIEKEIEALQATKEKLG